MHNFLCGSTTAVDDAVADVDDGVRERRLTCYLRYKISRKLKSFCVLVENIALSFMKYLRYIYSTYKAANPQQLKKTKHNPQRKPNTNRPQRHNSTNAHKDDSSRD